MSTNEPRVHVTLSLPREIYDRGARTAVDERRPLDDLLSGLVAEGLDAHAATAELLGRLSSSYRARLAQEGTLGRSADAVLQELREIREQVAHEHYS